MHKKPTFRERYLNWKAQEEKRSALGSPFHNSLVLLIGKIEYAFQSCLLCAAFVSIFVFIFIAFN